jgi:N-carbamoylputrescine amidase
MVCWDQWYPEAARLMALRGAQLLIYPTSIGWEPATSEAERGLMLDAWVTIQRSHAIANALPLISVNRVGFEPSTSANGGQIFWGNSLIIGPQGELLARANQDGEEVLTAQIDLAKTEVIRRNWPFLRDRRIDAYEGLLRRYRD